MVKRDGRQKSASRPYWEMGGTGGPAGGTGGSAGAAATAGGAGCAACAGGADDAAGVSDGAMETKRNPAPQR